MEAAPANGTVVSDKSASVPDAKGGGLNEAELETRYKRTLKFYRGEKWIKRTRRIKNKN
jgi:hypothetical protein